jgi:hypothetical protein
MADILVPKNQNMKRSAYFALAAAIVIALIIPGKAQAQTAKGQVVVGTNGAFSLVGTAMTLAFKGIGNIDGLTTHTTPGLSGTVDYGISRRFSLGVATFYQSASAKWNVYSDSSSGTNIYYNGDYHARVTRMNTGIRALFHFGNSDDFDPYFGFRVGVSYWNITSNVANIDALGNFKHFSTTVWPQAIFGVRYFFTPNIGVNGEFALGFPYFMSLGVNFRFGGLPAAK